jgi:alpha-L-fucosidase
VDPIAETTSACGPVPSPRQLSWHALEYYGFLHFTVNTFTDREWGHGDESPQVFAPTAFDADQIAETAAQAGMQGLVLTAKHHDGFCLWPTETTEHSVKNSPWKNGKGDVVREISEACARHNLKFGIYLSPWDRHHPEYGRPGYLSDYRRQLQELLTGYGPLFEVWFDGANGGDGFYGGKHERREIDARTYYEWETTFEMIRNLQPEACIFGGAGADIRWVGNERGIAGDPCWHTYDPAAAQTENQEVLNAGCRTGSLWYPAECDVSIRPGWFYHQREDRLVRSPENLLDLYFHSVGRGASLLLNVPPDPRGRIHARDRSALLEFRRLRDQVFSHDLAHTAQVTSPADSLPGCSPNTLVDGRRETYWQPVEDHPVPEVVLRFDAPVTFNVIDLREHLPLGQRVEDFSVEVESQGVWQTVYHGTMIGSRRLVRLQDQSTRAVRLRILKASCPPAVAALSLYRMLPARKLSLLDWVHARIFTRIP